MYDTKYFLKSTISFFSILLLLLNVHFSARLSAENHPSFTVTTLDSHFVSQQISSEMLKNKLVYLDLWATWCKPCQKSIPWMNSLHDQFSDKNFMILAVSVDNDLDTVKNFTKKLAIKYRIGFDQGGEKIASQFLPPTMPTSYLLYQGKIIETFVGFKEDDKGKIILKIRETLANSHD